MMRITALLMICFMQETNPKRFNLIDFSGGLKYLNSYVIFA